MELNDFVILFAAQFEETPAENFSPGVKFRDLDDWDSLTALSVISMIDEELEKQITGADLRSVNTIEELYKLAIAK